MTDLSDLSKDLNNLADVVQDKTAEAAAQVARAYGASDEVVRAILRLKTKEKAE